MADVAIYRFNETPVFNPLLMRLAKLTTPEILVLSHFLDAPKSLEEMGKVVFMREGELAKTVARLTRASLIRSGVAGRFTPSEWIKWIPQDLHFIEAKIDDWREAIEQARYYREYADGASVALPSSFSERTDVHEACRNAGVGLILVGANNETWTVLEPKTASPGEAPRRMSCYLQILRRYVLDFLHGPSFQPATI